MTIPFTYCDDNTPFVLAFIGDMWVEADLLGYAFAFEQATHGRIAPDLMAKHRG